MVSKRLMSFREPSGLSKRLNAYKKVYKKRDFEREFVSLKGKPKNISVFGFDIETHNNNKDFTLGSIYGDKIQKTFLNKQELINEIVSNQKYRNSYFSATNLGFDFFALFKPEKAVKHFDIFENNANIIFTKTYIPYNTNKLDFYNHSNMTMLKHKKKMSFYSITFIDSLNHYKASVDNISKIIGLEKLEKPEFLGQKPINEKELNQLIEYNMRDSEITYKFMSFLQREYNNLGCNLKTTISATAMDLFRRKYLKNTLINEGKKKILFQYKSYYGGRAEAFKRGLFEYPLNYYDFNSMYPYVMKEFPYPYPDSYFKKKTTMNDIETFEGVCKVKFKIKDLNIPLIPYRTEKLLFPQGSFKGFYDFASIREALRNNYEISELGNGYIYEHKFKPFFQYVSDLYSLKKKYREENNPLEIIPKILQNSLYGKFAFNYTNKERLSMFDDISRKDFQTHEVQPYYENPECLLFRIKSTENSKIPKYVFPILSLYTTAYSRIHLFRKLKKIGFENVYYVDTDSIITNKVLENSSELGELKKEYTFDKLCIIKPKFYSGVYQDKNVIKCKGLQRTITDFNMFIKHAEKDSFNFNVKLFSKFRGSLRNNRTINEIYDKNITFSLEDTKRVWKNKFSMREQNSKPITI